MILTHVELISHLLNYNRKLLHRLARLPSSRVARGYQHLERLQSIFDVKHHAKLLALFESHLFDPQTSQSSHSSLTRMLPRRRRTAEQVLAGKALATAPFLDQ